MYVCEVKVEGRSGCITCNGYPGQLQVLSRSLITLRTLSCILSYNLSYTLIPSLTPTRTLFSYTLAYALLYPLFPFLSSLHNPLFPPYSLLPHIGLRCAIPVLSFLPHHHTIRPSLQKGNPPSRYVCTLVNPL